MLNTETPLLPRSPPLLERLLFSLPSPPPARAAVSTRSDIALQSFSLFSFPTVWRQRRALGCMYTRNPPSFASS